MSETYRSSTRIGAARNFYVAMAMACLLFAFTGFLPTYWVPLAHSRFQAAPIVHIHAFFFFGWTLFFVAQTYFAANRELERHREFGVAGVALATAMVFTGVLMTIHSLAKDLVYDAAAAKAFSIVSFTAIAFFAIVVTLALVNVRRPEVHKRLMLLATVSILQAPVARWFLMALRPPDAVGAPPVAVSIAPGFVVDLLIVAAMIFDWRTRGRPHRVYVIGGALLLALQLLRLPLSATVTWGRIADAALALAR